MGWVKDKGKNAVQSGKVKNPKNPLKMRIPTKESDEYGRPKPMKDIRGTESWLKEQRRLRREKILRDIRSDKDREKKSNNKKKLDKRYIGEPGPAKGAKRKKK